MDRTVMTSLGEVQVLERLRVRTQDLYTELVEEYVEALREGAGLPPVQVAQLADCLVLIDGRHRIAAWMALDMPVSAELVGECSEAEALALALAANMRHGMRRNQGDVARCIHLALAMWPGSSNREIARRVGCSHTRVNQVVAEALPVERSFHSKVLEGSDVQLGSTASASTWRSPWTPESFQVVDEPWDDAQIVGARQRAAARAIGVDYGAEPPAQVVAMPRDISFADRMTELWGEEPEAVREQSPASEAAWVEDVDRELATMGPGRVLLALGETEAPVVQDDADAGLRFYSGGTVTLTLNDPALSEKLFAAVTGPKRHRGQDPLERWYTDPALATVCWRWLLESGLLKDVMPTCAGAQLRCLEPCVGGGAWVSGLEAASRSLGGDPSQASWVVMDADPEAPGLRLWKDRVAESVVGDFLTTPWDGWKFDLIISNPPNSLARDIIEESIRRLDWHGVAAFLLPASWMAAKRRRGWLSLNPPRVVALVPWRPSFEGPAAELQGTGEGSPTQDYALHVWVNGDPPGRSWRGTWMEDTSEVGDGEE